MTPHRITVERSSIRVSGFEFCASLDPSELTDTLGWGETKDAAVFDLIDKAAQDEEALLMLHALPVMEVSV